VLAIKVDTSKPDQSRAYVKFTDPKLDVHKEKDDTVLKPGERLFAPYQDIRVEAITGQGVVFAFDDATRAQETVTTSAYVSQRGAPVGIVQVGPEGVIYPNVERRIGVNTDFQPFRPEQLVQIRKNEFQVGTETLKELDRDYTDILSRDVSYTTHRDPRTGANDGIKINRVKEGSIPAQAGLTEGEVLKSINGHKVTSVNDAVAFVKANAETTDTWFAVFEKQGREFTRTYHSPER
jgi:membrane-associated protease RseP (regulator of RpoE activity)